MSDKNHFVCQKEDFKRFMAIVWKGCNYEICLSSDCPHFIRKESSIKNFASTEEKLVHYFKLFSMNSLDISCDEEKNKMSPIYPSFAELLNFKFNSLITLTPERLNELSENIKGLIEKLGKTDDPHRKIIISSLADYMAPEFYSLTNLFKKVLPTHVALVLLQTISFFHFFVDIEFFYNLPSRVRDFFSFLNFNHVYTKNLHQMLRTSAFNLPFFGRFIENLQNSLTVNIIESQGDGEGEACIKKIKELCEILNFFYLANQLLPLTAQIPYTIFINDSIMTEVDIKKNLLLFLRGMLPRKLETEIKFIERLYPYIGHFNFLHYSFLFDTVDKVDLLKMESYFLQDSEIENFLLNEPLNYILDRNAIFLELVLRREFLLEDSLNQLALNTNILRLKRPLKIHFVGEPGVDEGGLTKEFFQLLSSQLFAPGFGMFEEKNSRFLWFDARSFECKINFALAGILLGLALYNQVIIELPFSLVVYKKLILYHKSLEPQNQLSLDDLMELDPELYFSLKNVLQCDMDNEQHGLVFSVEKDFYGEVKAYELIPNGAEVIVKNANKELFVDSYLDWYFNTSIQEQFVPFADGFFSVISGRVFKMFSAKEFFAALNGSDNLNFNDLKSSTQYDQGYTKDCPTIKHFWKVIEGFSDDKRRLFLKFLTGSPRAPLRGLKEIRMIISRNGDNKERLPSAHTCFNHLLLPDYNSLEILHQKLTQALEHSEGFGLI